MKARATKSSSGVKRVHKADRLAKEPIRKDAKRRRLIARLKSFGQSGNMNEAIATLRKRLHPFVVKPKVKVEREEFQVVLIEAIGGEDEYSKAKNEINKRKRQERSRNNRKSS